jgi:hypothetical protein
MSVSKARSRCDSTSASPHHPMLLRREVHTPPPPADTASTPEPPPPQSPAASKGRGRGAAQRTTRTRPAHPNKRGGRPPIDSRPGTPARPRGRMGPGSQWRWWLPGGPGGWFAGAAAQPMGPRPCSLQPLARDSQASPTGQRSLQAVRAVRAARGHQPTHQKPAH